MRRRPSAPQAPSFPNCVLDRPCFGNSIALPSDELPANTPPEEREIQWGDAEGKRAYSRNYAGFTLLEILASTAVLALLVVMITQLMNSATSITTANRKRLNADSVARMVFDRMSGDFSNMVMRQDVDVICKGIPTSSGSLSMSGAGGGGNDAIYFFSRSAAYYNSQTLDSPKSNLALVGYRINSNTASPSYGQLERLGKGLTRDGQPSASGMTNGMTFLPNSSGTCDLTGATGYLSSYISTNGNPSIGTYGGNFSDSNDDNFHAFGEGVYRLEYGYLLKPFSNPDGAFQPARFSSVPYDTVQGHTGVCGWQDVAAIMVTIAILDKESEKMLPANASTGAIDSSVMGKMQEILPDFDDSTPPLQSWQSEVISTNFASNCGNIPKAAASQVRVYQRYFYLNKK